MEEHFILNKPHEELTFSDLRCHYGTGRSYIKFGSGRNRVLGYRYGVMTDMGDIEYSQWAVLVMKLIERSKETEVLNALERWTQENCVWLHSKKDVEEYALDLHSSRIFEDPKWVAYEQFRDQYAPWLKDKEGP